MDKEFGVLIIWAVLLLLTTITIVNKIQLDDLDDEAIEYKHQIDSLQLVIEDQQLLLSKYRYYVELEED